MIRARIDDLGRFGKFGSEAMKLYQEVRLTDSK